MEETKREVEEKELKPEDILSEEEITELKDKVKEEIKQQIVNNAIIIEAKHKVQHIVDCLKALQKKNGKNKKAIKAIKVMEKFLNCHIKSGAIMKRYFEVTKLMEEYAHATQG